MARATRDAAPVGAVRSTRVVTPQGERAATVVIEDGRISAIAPHDTPPEAAASGLLDVGDLPVLPGFVDSHVHVNEPGRTDWEGFATATRAAALAGITTLVDMPLNSLPPTVDPDALATKRRAAQDQLHVDVALWGGVVPGSSGHVAALAAAGVCGFKLFTCDSGVAEYPPITVDRLEDTLAAIAPTRLPTIVHAEAPEVLAAHAPDPTADRRAYTTWLRSRPDDAEVVAITRLLDAARATGAPVHVLHLSSAAALEPIRAARAAGVALTVETCPHYLSLEAASIADGDTLAKCAPPIRDHANREALWAAVLDGTIDLIVSDHSPSPPAGKHLDTGDLLAAWGGIASLQLGPSLVWHHGRARGLTLTMLAARMAEAPARLAGLDAKGRVAVGADADLVVFDPTTSFTVDAARLAHRHPITPYHGHQLTGRAVTTILRGRIVADDGLPRPTPTGHLLVRG